MPIRKSEDIAITLITFAKLVVWLLVAFILTTAILSPESVGSWWANAWYGAVNTTLDKLQ